MNGILKRTNLKSFFACCHYKSTMAEELFNHEPSYKNKPCQVMQVMMIEGGYLLIECIFINTK